MKAKYYYSNKRVVPKKQVLKATPPKPLGTLPEVTSPLGGAAYNSEGALSKFYHDFSRGGARPLVTGREDRLIRVGDPSAPGGASCSEDRFAVGLSEISGVIEGEFYDVNVGGVSRKIVDDLVEPVGTRITIELYRHDIRIRSKPASGSPGGGGSSFRPNPNVEPAPYEWDGPVGSYETAKARGTLKEEFAMQQESKRKARAEARIRAVSHYERLLLYYRDPETFVPHSNCELSSITSLLSGGILGEGGREIALAFPVAGAARLEDGAWWEGSGRTTIRDFSQHSRNQLKFALRNAACEWLTMITLTYPKVFPRCGKVVKSHLNTFLTTLRKAHRGLKYGWVLEFQSRGAPHFHIFTTCSPSPSWVSRIWYGIVKSEDPRHLAAGTQVKALTTRDEAIGYITNYANKMDQKAVPEGFSWPGRFWACSRGLAPAVAVLEDVSLRQLQSLRMAYNTYLERPELRKDKMSGVLWCVSSAWGPALLRNYYDAYFRPRVAAALESGKVPSDKAPVDSRLALFKDNRGGGISRTPFGGVIFRRFRRKRFWAHDPTVCRHRLHEAYLYGGRKGSQISEESFLASGVEKAAWESFYERLAKQTIRRWHAHNRPCYGKYRQAYAPKLKVSSGEVGLSRVMDRGEYRRSLTKARWLRAHQTNFCFKRRLRKMAESGGCGTGAPNNRLLKLRGALLSPYLCGLSKVSKGPSSA